MRVVMPATKRHALLNPHICLSMPFEVGANTFRCAEVRVTTRSTRQPIEQFNNVRNRISSKSKLQPVQHEYRYIEDKIILADNHEHYTHTKGVEP
eukprot:6205390-Pleurochrysis_carterae.AAC.2